MIDKNIYNNTKTDETKCIINEVRKLETETGSDMNLSWSNFNITPGSIIHKPLRFGVNSETQREFGIVDIKPKKGEISPVVFVGPPLIRMWTNGTKALGICHEWNFTVHFYKDKEKTIKGEYEITGNKLITEMVQNGYSLIVFKEEQKEQYGDNKGV